MKTGQKIREIFTLSLVFISGVFRGWLPSLLLLMYKSAPIGFVFARISNGRIIHANNGFERLSGRSQSELRQVPFIDFVHKEDVESTIEAMQVIIDGGGVGNFSNRYRKPDGSYSRLYWISARFGDWYIAIAAPGRWE